MAQATREEDRPSEDEIALKKLGTAETGVVETRFECCVSGMESRASRAAPTIRQRTQGSLTNVV
jgi:hypothetical protein